MTTFVDSIDLNKLNLSKSDKSIEQLLNDIKYNDYPYHFKIKKKDKKKILCGKILGKLDFLYFILMSDYILLAIATLPPILWHTIKTTNELDSIIHLYFNTSDNTNNNTTLESIFRGFIGNEDDSYISISALIKFIFLHPLIDKLIWGPNYNKPKKHHFSKLNPLEMAINIEKILIQNEEFTEINAVTKYSKSIISFVEKEGSLFVEIKYLKSDTTSFVSPEIKKINETCGFSFNENLPHDVIGILSIFPKISSHIDLLQLDPPEIKLSLMISAGIPVYLSQTKMILNDLFVERSKFSPDVSSNIHDTLMTLTINEEFDKIFDYNTITNINNNIDEQSMIILNQCKYNKDFDKKKVLEYIKYLLNASVFLLQSRQS